MELLKTLSKEQIREFFSKNWLPHDAMWYGSSVEELGPEKANQSNKTAVRLMTGIEIQRVLALMGMAKRDDNALVFFTLSIFCIANPRICQSWFDNSRHLAYVQCKFS